MMVRYGIIVILLLNIVELHIIIVIKYMLFLNIFQLFFLNLRGYDSHFIVQNLGIYKEKIDITPNNTEKFMLLVLVIAKINKFIQ